MKTREPQGTHRIHLDRERPRFGRVLTPLPQRPQRVCVPAATGEVLDQVVDIRTDEREPFSRQGMRQLTGELDGVAHSQEPPSTAASGTRRGSPSSGNSTSPTTVTPIPKVQSPFTLSAVASRRDGADGILCSNFCTVL